jgi:hypothetical protein
MVVKNLNLDQGPNEQKKPGFGHGCSEFRSEKLKRKKIVQYRKVLFAPVAWEVIFIRFYVLYFRRTEVNRCPLSLFDLLKVLKVSGIFN